MVADTQVIPFGLDVGIDHLVVEKLRVLRLSCYAPRVVVEQAAEKRATAPAGQGLQCALGPPADG